MAHESVLRGPLTILGSLPDGAGDNILTIDSVTGAIGSVASIGGDYWPLSGSATLTDSVTIQANFVSDIIFHCLDNGPLFRIEGFAVTEINSFGALIFSSDSEDISFDGSPVNYANDYSASFTPFSLVDKNYVDTRALSGTYTPTLTNTSNIDSSTAYPCQYMRVGNTVTVSGRVEIDPTAANSIILGISLPIASNFAAASGTECAGVCANSGATMEAGAIFGDDVNNRATLSKSTTLTVSHTMFFTFTYQVI